MPPRRVSINICIGVAPEAVTSWTTSALSQYSPRPVKIYNMTIKLSQDKRDAPDFLAPMQGGLPRRGWGVLCLRNNPSDSLTRTTSPSRGGELTKAFLTTFIAYRQLASTT